MSEGVVVILGTLTILSFVAVSIVALVYNRSLMIRARTGDNAIQVQTDEGIAIEPATAVGAN